MINIYVGNLPYSASDSELEQLFSQHGQVVRAQILIDRQTGRSRGFGFVEMNDPEQGRAAIAALDGFDMGGRKLRVNEAQPREQSAGGGGGRGGFGGGGGGGGRGGYAGGGNRGGGYSGGSGYRGRRDSGGGDSGGGWQ